MKYRFFLFFLINTQLVFSQPDQSSILKVIALEMIKDTKFCVLSSVSINGEISSRIMDPHLPNDDFVIFLVTNPLSRKVSEIKNNPNVTLLFQNESGYVSLNGEVSFVLDQSKKNIFWKDSWTPHYYDKKKALVLKVKPKMIEVINQTRNIKGDPINWAPAKIKF